jgi:hypothetical protein
MLVVAAAVQMLGQVVMVGRAVVAMVRVLHRELLEPSLREQRILAVVVAVAVEQAALA